MSRWAILFTLLTGCGGEIASTEAESSSSDLTAGVFDAIQFGNELMRLTNLDRESLGYSPLYTDATLASIARDAPFVCPSTKATLYGRSKDMALRNYLSHDILGCNDTDGSTYAGLDLVMDRGYNTFRGENIAWNTHPLDASSYTYGCDLSGANCQGTSSGSILSISAVALALMKSSTHRSNILGDWDRFGCGAWRDAGGSRTYYTCLFSKAGPNAVTSDAMTGTWYEPLVPTRLLDTRTGNGLSGSFSSGSPRTFQVTGRAGIPSSAIAVTGNLTVTGATGGGYLYLGAESTSSPATSTLNFPAGDTRANGVTVLLGRGGTLSAVYNGATTGSTTSVIFDVTGYFALDDASALYESLVPARLLDTRTGSGLSGTFIAGAPRTFTVAGRGGVPPDAIAVTGNLAVTGQSASGFVSLGPTATSTPSYSTINFPGSDTRANNVTVQLGAGTLSAVYGAASGATTHLVFDVTGYFSRTSAGKTFIPLPSARLLDTRTGNGLSGAFASGIPRTFQVTGRGAVAVSATAVTGNLAVTAPSASGYVAIGPIATSTPSTSNLNFPLNDTRANGLASMLGVGGKLSAVYGASAGATTHLIFDVTGYFR